MLEGLLRSLRVQAPLPPLEGTDATTAHPPFDVVTELYAQEGLAFLGGYASARKDWSDFFRRPGHPPAEHVLRVLRADCRRWKKEGYQMGFSRWLLERAKLPPELAEERSRVTTRAGVVDRYRATRQAIEAEQGAIRRCACGYPKRGGVHGAVRCEGMR